MAREEVTVWIDVAEHEAKCEYGHKHKITTWASKKLGPIIEMREHANGYEKRMTEVRADRQGRTYHQRVEIDYFNNVWWLREDGTRFLTRPRGGGGNIDIFGRNV